MSRPSSTKVWIVAHPPTDKITDETFKLEERPLEGLKDGEVLAKVLYLSNDPAQRGWIQKDADPKRLYVPPIRAGQVMGSNAMLEVVESKSSKWKVGQKVLGGAGWVEYAVLQEDKIRPAVEIEGHTPTIALSYVGMTATTAWVGLHEIGHIKQSDVVVVSGAAGATGSMVVQIAKKLVGAKKVIGIAGGSKKCDWVKTLGADECVDYKSDSFEADLAKACNGEANIYFDNVGGNILDLMLMQMAKFGRVAACGSISNYNGGDTVLKNWFQVISMGIHIEGFIAFWYQDSVTKGIEALTEGVKNGKIITEGGETVVDGKFEDIPELWQGLFTGKNTGKLITAIKQ